MTATRVIVADDDVLLREGLASLLQREGFDVVGQAGDGEELLALARELEPQVAIVDIRMPPNHATEGLDAARELRSERHDIGILLLSAHVEVEHALELLASGEGTGYLLKSRVTDVEGFVDTVRADRRRRIGGGPRAGARAGRGHDGATTRSNSSPRASGRCSP